MKPSEAFNKLTSRVNIEFYVGPHIAKVIKDACIAADGEEAKAASESKKDTAPKEAKGK